MNLFLLISWIIIGIANMSKDEIDKIDYILCWTALICQLLLHVFEY